MMSIDTERGSYKWLVLGVAALANFSAALDMSIVVVSFPRLTEVFNTDPSVIIWLIIAFSIAQLGLLMTIGKIGDTWGRKRIFVIGIILYTVALGLCAISPNISMLIASRFIQGAGAAIIMTLGAAIVVAVFPQDQQGRAIGLFTMLVAIGLIAGPALGGVLIDYLDWQGIFYTRIPIGIICLVATWLIVKEQKKVDAPLKIDLGGALTLLVGMACLLLYLNLGDDLGYGSYLSLTLIAACVISLGSFFFIEKHVSDPVLDLGLFKNRVFTMTGLTTVFQISGGAMAPILIPFFLIDGLALAPSVSGGLMALIAIPPLVFSPLSGWLSDKIGNRILMVVATICFTLALYLASRLNIDSATIDVALVLMLFGAGMGIFQAPNQSAIISAAPRASLATSMGVANTMKMLGSATGMAIAGTLYAQQQAARLADFADRGLAGGLTERLSVIGAYQSVMFLAAMISVVSILTSFFTGNKAPRGMPEVSNDQAGRVFEE
jgi:EmrB/QacA subfamily drug resistance transporter